MLGEILSSKGVKWIAGGWIGFISENILLSSWREEIKKEIGDDNYHYTYNSLSTIACTSIAYGFLRHGRGRGPSIGARSLPAHISSFIFQALGFIGFSQGFPKLQLPVSIAQIENPSVLSSSSSSSKSSNSTQANKNITFSVRCPMDFRPKDIPVDGIFGMDRISRHAMLWSFGFVGLGYACGSVFIPEIVFGAFPLAFAWIGGAHQDHRFRKGSGGVLTTEMEEKTSNIPFLALLRGSQDWGSVRDELKLSNAGIGLSMAAFLAMRRFRRR